MVNNSVSSDSSFTSNNLSRDFLDDKMKTLETLVGKDDSNFFLINKIQYFIKNSIFARSLTSGIIFSHSQEYLARGGYSGLPNEKGVSFIRKFIDEMLQKNPHDKDYLELKHLFSDIQLSSVRNNLEKKGKALFDAGWFYTTGGHAVMGLIEKQEDEKLRFSIVNTGSSSLNHHREATVNGVAISQVVKIVKNIKFEDFFSDKTNKVFTSLKSSHGEDVEKRENFYKWIEDLNGTEITSGDMRDWDIRQLGGSCLGQSLMGMIRHRLPPEKFEAFEQHHRLKTLTQEYTHWKNGGDHLETRRIFLLNSVQKLKSTVESKDYQTILGKIEKELEKFKNEKSLSQKKWRVLEKGDFFRKSGAFLDKASSFDDPFKRGKPYFAREISIMERCKDLYGRIAFLWQRWTVSGHSKMDPIKEASPKITKIDKGRGVVSIDSKDPVDQLSLVYGLFGLQMDGSYGISAFTTFVNMMKNSTDNDYVSLVKNIHKITFPLKREGLDKGSIVRRYCILYYLDGLLKTERALSLKQEIDGQLSAGKYAEVQKNIRNAMATYQRFIGKHQEIFINPPPCDAWTTLVSLPPMEEWHYLSSCKDLLKDYFEHPDNHSEDIILIKPPQLSPEVDSSIFNRII